MCLQSQDAIFMMYNWVPALVLVVPMVSQDMPLVSIIEAETAYSNA